MTERQEDFNRRLGRSILDVAKLLGRDPQTFHRLSPNQIVLLSPLGNLLSECLHLRLNVDAVRNAH